jgi:hypothetical protein
MRRILPVVALALALSGCVHDIARSQVKSALVGAGLSEPVSQCMSDHMVDKLSIPQLRKLEALEGPKRSLFDYVRAVQRINDPEVIRVTVAAAGLCMSGWER